MNLKFSRATRSVKNIDPLTQKIELRYGVVDLATKP